MNPVLGKKLAVVAVVLAMLALPLASFAADAALSSATTLWHVSLRGECGTARLPGPRPLATGIPIGIIHFRRTRSTTPGKADESLM